MENNEFEKLFNEEMMRPDPNSFVDMAKNLRMIFESFVTAGFTESQALELTMGLQKAAISVAASKMDAAK